MTKPPRASRVKLAPAAKPDAEPEALPEILSKALPEIAPEAPSEAEALLKCLPQAPLVSATPPQPTPSLAVVAVQKIQHKQPNRVHHAYSDDLFDEILWGLNRVPFSGPLQSTRVFLGELKSSGTLHEKRSAVMDVALNMSFETHVEFREDQPRGTYGRITRTK